MPRTWSGELRGQEKKMMDRSRLIHWAAMALRPEYRRRCRRERDIYQLGKNYSLGKDALDSITAVRPYTMASLSRLATLYNQAVYCETNGIAGSFVECGVWRGGAVGLMALGNMKHGSRRRHLHLFDSFEGIPEPDERVDGKKALQQVRSVGGQTGGRLAAVEGFYEKYSGGPATLEDNRELLEGVLGYDPSFIHYHKGWFQDTLPKDAGETGEIAILRLDGDWYASTKVCLEHLYDKVVKGGFIIIDDYGCYEGCRKAVDEFMEKNGIRAYLNFIDSSGRYWINP